MKAQTLKKVQKEAKGSKNRQNTNSIATEKANLVSMANKVTLEDINRAYDLPKSTYGAVLEKAMLERQVSIRDLAATLLCSYEHVRQILAGGRNVSPMMNRAICSFFDLDEEEMLRMARVDQMMAQYGDLVQGEKPQDPILRAVSNSWPLLTDTQKNLIAKNVSQFVYQNRAHGVFKRDDV